MLQKIMSCVCDLANDPHSLVGGQPGNTVSHSTVIYETRRTAWGNIMAEPWFICESCVPKVFLNSYYPKVLAEEPTWGRKT